MVEPEKYPVHFDQEVQEALRGVRFVFELGFPADMVDRSRALIRRLSDPRRSSNKREARFPGCYLLAVVAAARHYDGHALWSSDHLDFVQATPQARAGMALEALQTIGLDTFHDVVEQENALRLMTPILMHAGLPTSNVPDLVELVTSARRNHIVSAEEQISRWSRTPNGFAGLWRAPQLFFRFGGDAATDLLERVNEALDSDEPLSVGLPRHLGEAIGRLDDATRERVRRVGVRRFVQRPNVVFDAWSCEGPRIEFAASDPAQISKWRLTGAVSLDTRVQPHGHSVPLLPVAEWTAHAIDTAGSTIGSWAYPAYSDLPVMVFDAESGRLLKHRAGFRETESGVVHVLARSEVTLSGGEETGAILPEPVGEWYQWRAYEFAVRGSTTLECAGPAGSHQTLRLVAAPRRPELAPNGLVSNVRGAAGEVVFDRPPSLLITAGVVDPDAIVIRVIDSAGHATSASLADVGGGPVVDLSALFGADGAYDVAVDGPLGLRMKASRVLVLRDLVCDQKPSPLLPGETGVITLTSRSASSVCDIDGTQGEVQHQLDTQPLTIDVSRASWATRRPSAAVEPLGTERVSLSVDDLSGLSPALLTVDLGVAAFAEVELRRGDDVLQVLRPTRISNRWTVSLGALHDTVVAAVVESLDLVLALGGRRAHIGRVISTYIPTCVSGTSDPAIEPAVISIQLVENKAFNQRVARVWNLERPWEPSLCVAIADGARSTVLVPLADGHPQGRYRVWIRLEEPWSLPPEFPPRSTPGVIDVDVECGSALDLEAPVDRVVAAARGDVGVVTVDDLESHGHLVVALLSQGVADEGTRFFSTPLAARLLTILRQNPSSLVRSISASVDSGVVKRSVAGPLALSLAPLLLELEEQVDLQLEGDIAEAMWTLMPLAAAIVERWDDSDEALERWIRHVGWPAAAKEPGDSSIRFPALPRLPDTFAQQFIRLVDQPDLGLDLHGLSEQLLHRDYQFRALLAAIELYGAPEIETWTERYDSTMRRVRSGMDRISGAGLVRDASLERSTGAAWFLSDIAALAANMVARPDSSPDAHLALMDAYDLAPSWLTHCVLFALANSVEDELKAQILFG